MEITIALIASGVAFLLSIISLFITAKKADKADIRTIADAHNWFMELCSDVYEDLVDQMNERVDKTNEVFMEMEDLFKENKDILNDIIDVIGLGLDADEILMEKINMLEDENEYIFDTLDEYDDVIDTIYAIFEDEPEEAGEEEKPVKNKKK